ncbi:TonB-dependent receptor domain-containing protein, partial [Aliarcobacter butzleri]
SAKYELPFEEHFLVIGTEYLQAQLKDDAFTLTKGNNNKKEYDMWSVFAEDNWNIIDPLTFTTGVRYDKHEDFGSHVSPR